MGQEQPSLVPLLCSLAEGRYVNAIVDPKVAARGCQSITFPVAGSFEGDLSGAFPWLAQLSGSSQVRRVDLYNTAIFHVCSMFNQPQPELWAVPTTQSMTT